LGHRAYAPAEAFFSWFFPLSPIIRLCPDGGRFEGGSCASFARKRLLRRKGWAKNRFSNSARCAVLFPRWQRPLRGDGPQHLFRRPGLFYFASRLPRRRIVSRQSSRARELRNDRFCLRMGRNVSKSYEAKKWNHLRRLPEPEARAYRGAKAAERLPFYYGAAADWCHGTSAERVRSARGFRGTTARTQGIGTGGGLVEA